MRIFQIFQNFTRNERRTFLGALLVFLIAGGFWLGFYFYNHTTEVPIASNLYTEGVIGQPIFINPVLAGTNDVDRDLSELLFNNLIGLTDHYNISPDGKTWQIFLKNDLLWDDGKPINSDDVIFTLETIQNPESRSPLFASWQGVVANRISEFEIDFTLRTPYAFFLDNLKDLRIIPKHIFGIIPPANLGLSAYNLEPIGDGPYKFVSYKKRMDGFITEYDLEANKNYSLGQPFIQNFTMKFFTDATALIAAFNTRKIDGFGDLSPQNINDLKLSRQILEFYIPRYYAVFFNPNSNDLLNDTTIKTAMALAVDKNKIVGEVFNGKALTVDQPLLPILPDYQPVASTSLPDFNPDKANSLLEAAKWIKGTDGVRQKTNGKNTQRLEFDIIVPQIPFLQQTVDIIKDEWQAVGIKLNPIVLAPLDIANEVIKTRNYQMIIFGNVLKLNPDIFAFWHSSERFYPGLNLALYKNSKVDTLLETIRKDSDEDSRKKELAQLNSLILQDQPALFLYSPTYLYIAPKSLSGLNQKIIATPSDRFENVNQWYLRTARIFK